MPVDVRPSAPKLATGASSAALSSLDLLLLFFFPPLPSRSPRTLLI